MSQPTQTRELASDHYTQAQAFTDAAALVAGQMWDEVNPNRVIDSWAEQVPELTAVVSGAQLGTARQADSYIADALEVQDLSTEAVAPVDPAGFSGTASDGRPLLSLLTSPAFVTVATIADGVDVLRAMQFGRASLDTIVRTQVADAGRLADQVSTTAHLAADGYIRQTDGNPCARCLILAGRFYQFNEGFLRHPRCLPAGVVVSTPGVRAATRRWYEGELVEISTASGLELPVTGNHPVLTDRGWVPARLLREGDHVARSIDGHASPARGRDVAVPYEDQIPTRIEDLWRSHSVLSLGRVPTSAEDFHGDGGHGEVDVVTANSLLVNGVLAQLAQPARELALVGGDVPVLRIGRSGTLPLDRAPRQLGFVANDAGECAAHLLSVFGAGDSNPGSAFSLLHGSGERWVGLLAGSSEPSGLKVRPDLNASALEAEFDSPARDPMLASEVASTLASEVIADQSVDGQIPNPARWDASADPLTVDGRDIYAERGRDLLKRLSGQVSLDRVVEVRRTHFAGHVYNLDSVEGWYSAANIILSNCGCTHVPAGGRMRPPDPRAVYDRMTARQRSRAGFTLADQRALAEGGDIFQIVNARHRPNVTTTVAGERPRGLRRAQRTMEGTGPLSRAALFRVDPATGRFVPRLAVDRPRWTVDEIYRVAGDDRALAIDLLGEFGYLRAATREPTIRDLRQAAKALGLRNYSDQSARQIVQRLQGLDVFPPPSRLAQVLAQGVRGGAPGGAAAGARAAADLSRLTVAELRDLAKERGVVGYSRMRKAELVDALGSPTPVKAAAKAAKKAAPRKAAAPDLTGTRRGLSTDPAVRAVQVENRVRQAYQDAVAAGGRGLFRPASRHGDYVGMGEIRARLADLDRAEVDAALTRIVRNRDGSLYRREDQWRIHPADEAASIRLGAENLTSLQMDNPALRPLPAAPVKAAKKAAAPAKAAKRVPAKKAARTIEAVDARQAAVIDDISRAVEGLRGRTDLPKSELVFGNPAYFNRAESLHDSFREGGWVAIADIRDALGEKYSRTEVDEALIRMMRDDDIRAIPIAQRAALMQRDRDAALVVNPMGGGGELHWFRIDGGPVRATTVPAKKAVPRAAAPAKKAAKAAAPPAPQRMSIAALKTELERAGVTVPPRIAKPALVDEVTALRGGASVDEIGARLNPPVGTGTVGRQMSALPRVADPQDVRAQALATNPRNGKAYLGPITPEVERAGSVGYSVNCTRVVIAYEMRRRGIDVTAGAGILTGDIIAAYVRAFRLDGRYASRIARDLTQKKSAKQIAAEVQTWPLGARGIIEMDGHTLMVERDRLTGRVVFIDAQNADKTTVMTLAQFERRAKARGARIDVMYVARVDDLDMSDYALRYVESPALDLADGQVGKTSFPQDPDSETFTSFDDMADLPPDDRYP